MRVVRGLRELAASLSRGAPPTVAHVDLSGSTPLCANIMCAKLGEPCVCRLAGVLEECAERQPNVTTLSLENCQLRAVPEAVFLFSRLETLNLKRNLLDARVQEQSRVAAFKRLPALRVIEF